jgi:tetratricopeptide (TPR) repeat protein
MRRFAILSVLLASAAVAQTPTVQQRFDAARQKLETDDAAGALAELEALETYLKAQPRPNPTNIAVTQAQKADSLLKLGRADQAKPLLNAALSGGVLDKPALKSVRENALLLLAGIMEGELDHAGARAEYLRLAEVAAEPITRTLALMGAARTEMFLDAPAALRHIDQALSLAEKDLAVGKRELANVLGLKGRILLNSGQTAGARALLTRAVGLRGGLTPKVNQIDVALRADAAIAMLRLGQDEDARKYLAYTGAGRTDEQLHPPVEMPLPPCGEGLDPQDSAIIEFSILDDGRVIAPRPVFASKPGDAAYEFARYVGRWSWEPANAAKVNPFFRVAARAEVRCTTRNERPRATYAFEQESGDWFDKHGLKALTGYSDAARALELEARLKVSGPDTAERLGVLMWLTRNATVEGKRRLQYAADAVALAARLKAPLSLRLVIALDHAGIHAIQNARTYDDQVASELESLSALRARPEFAEAAMQATLDLRIAQAAGYLKRSDVEQSALIRVAERADLSDKHPLKVAALVQLANIYAAAKQTENAAVMYDRTGLTAKQCALVDGGPVMLKAGTGKFPNEAYGWGFEGWTSLEYDVAADGTTRNARTVAAFPPAVFAKASEAIPRTMRYRVSYRPEGDLACTAMSRRVRFSLP